MRRAAVLSLLFTSLMAGAPARAAELAATPATLDAALRSAKAGDVVKLTGVGPNLSLQAAASAPLTLPAPGVTLDLTGQTLNWMQVANVANLTIKGGSYTASDWRGCVWVGAVSHVTITGVTCGGAGMGVVLRGGDHVTVSDSTFNGPVLYIGGVSDFLVTGNRFVNARTDGIDIAGAGPGKILGNACDGANTDPGVHPDCIQNFGAVQPYPVLSHDIEIAGTTLHGAMQGIDSFQGAQREYVHDNVIVSTMPQGIAMYRCEGCVVANNHVSTIPGSPFQSSVNNLGMKGLQCGNVVDAYGRYPTGRDRACKPAELAAASGHQP